MFQIANRETVGTVHTHTSNVMKEHIFSNPKIRRPNIIVGADDSVRTEIGIYLLQ